MTFSCELIKEVQALDKRKQCTLEKSFSFSGVGLFTGEQATICLRPADANTGIVFKCIDFPEQPVIPAQLSYLRSSPRCTMLSNGKVSVQTVEHLLAALRAYEIDNVIIEISGPEVPIFDGSSARFAEAIEANGVSTQEALVSVFKLTSPVFWSQGDVHLVALPADEYRISYTLHYPHSPFIGSQFYSLSVDAEKFKRDIAPCRTFSLYDEIAPLIQKGLVKGGSLESGIVINEEGVMNPQGLRFSDEMVRHKILDLMGDLSLVSMPFLAHVIAIRSGHASNHAFASCLLNHIQRENS